jgi:acyl-CoA hydrolase
VSHSQTCQVGLVKKILSRVLPIPHTGNMQPKPVSDSEVVMTELVLPSHTNAIGSVFGGQVMAWIDICAAIASQRHSQKQVVTARVDALTFVQPVFKGWVINLRASVNFTGRTSMEVGVRVDAENPTTGEKFHTASAYLTFVAMGPDMKPTDIPPVLPVTEAQKRRHAQAKIRRANRLSLRDQTNV